MESNIEQLMQILYRGAPMTGRQVAEEYYRQADGTVPTLKNPRRIHGTLHNMIDSGYVRIVDKINDNGRVANRYAPVGRATTDKTMEEAIEEVKALYGGGAIFTGGIIAEDLGVPLSMARKIIEALDKKDAIVKTRQPSPRTKPKEVCYTISKTRGSWA